MSTLDKLLKEATDDFLVEGDWEKYIHICELINSIQDGDKLTATVQQNLNNANKPRSQTRSMELLQSGMQNNFFVVRAVHRPAFQQFLVDLANSKTFEYNLKNKLLNLIRAWGVAFPANSHLPNFGRTLEFLIQKRIPFPAVSDDSNYSPPPADVELHQPVQPARPAPYVPEPHPRQLIIPGGHPGVVQGVPVHVYPGPAQAQVKLETMTIPKLTELLTSQNLLRELMQAINVQLESPQDNELIKDLFQTCSDAQPNVVESISRVTDERLLSMMLQFNDAMMELTELWRSLHQQHQQAKLRPAPVAVPIVSAPAPVPVFQPMMSPPKSSAFTGLDAPIELNLNFANEASGHHSHSAQDDEDFKLPAPGKYDHPQVAHHSQPAHPPRPVAEEVDLFADFDALVISRHKDSPNHPAPAAPKPTTASEDLLSLLSGPPVQATAPQSVPMPFQSGPSMMPFQNQPNPYPMYAMSPPGGYYQPPMNPVGQPTTSMMGMPGFSVNPGTQPHPVPQQHYGNPPLGAGAPGTSVAFPQSNQNVQNTPDVFKDLLI